MRRVLLAAFSLADWVTASAILVVALTTAITARKAWQSSSWRRLVPGAVVSVFGLLLLLAFYRWGFAEGSCDGRGDLVCITNENQGVLTLLALFIAAVAIWVEVLSRQEEERREAKKRKERANKVVRAAIAECRHNLVHIGLCYEERDGMIRIPWGISIESVTTLGRPEIRPDVSELLLDRLDAFRRTYATVQECRASVHNARSEEDHKEAEQFLLSEPEPFKAFVMQNMGFLINAWSHYADVPECRKILERSGLQDVPRIVRAAAEAGGRFNCFRTSDEETQEEAATIRTKERPVVCWIDDSPIGVKTFAFKPRFADAAKAHRH